MNSVGVGRVPENPRVRVFRSRPVAFAVSLFRFSVCRHIQYHTEDIPHILDSMCLPTIQHTVAPPLHRVDNCSMPNTQLSGPTTAADIAPAHRRTDSASAQHGRLAGWRDKVSTLAPEALFSRRTLCNLSPLPGRRRWIEIPGTRPGSLPRWISVTALVSGQSSCPKRRSSPATEWVEGGAWAHGSWGLHPVRFPSSRKAGRMGGGRMMGPAACWSRSFNSNSNLARGEEHPAARARTIIISCPFRTSRFVASWADLRGVSTAIHDEWIGLVQQGN